MRRGNSVAAIGVVDAGGTEAAYAEAIDVAGAKSSYGREAAGVYAAAVRPDAALLVIARGADGSHRTVTLGLSSDQNPHPVGARALPPERLGPPDHRLAIPGPGFAEARLTALANRTVEVSP